MTDSGYVLFRRDSQDQESLEDVWDDSALIRAYDRAVSAAKDKVASKLGISEGEKSNEADTNGGGSNKPERNKKPVRTNWKIGDYVRAPYSVDGIVYEAVIEKIYKSNNSCKVRFLGYNNDEDVSIQTLEPSGGEESRNQQIEAAAELSSDEMETEGSNKECSNHTKSSPFSKWEPVQSMLPNPFPSGAHFPMPPPPPPASWPGNQSNLDDPDSLYSMLMSWYMAGYHTGYYQGVQQHRSGKQSSSGKMNEK